MSFNAKMLRRYALRTAGIGLLAGALTGASIQAQARPSEQTQGFGPATAPFRGKIYALWKGSGSDVGLWYASSDGAEWSAPARIPKVASSAAPSLAVFDDALYVAWKGENADQRLWYASFDGSQWSPQTQIPGAASNSGPALSVFKGRLHVAWTGPGTGGGLFSASFDGARWSTDSKADGVHPFPPHAIASSGLSGAGGINQGKRNDCVFEASAAAVATTARGRAAISEMIVQNADGSYAVTFPGEPRNRITVTQSDLKTTRVSDSAAWAGVIEAALIKWNPKFADGAKMPANAKGAPRGAAPTPAQYALHLLTGSPASKDVASSPKIGDRISEALGRGRPVVAFCANNDQGALVSGHEWTIIACDTHAQRITLRNPWGKFGTAGTTKGGVAYDGYAEVTMTLQQFAQFYKEVTFGYDGV